MSFCVTSSPLQDRSWPCLALWSPQSVSWQECREAEAFFGPGVGAEEKKGNGQSQGCSVGHPTSPTQEVQSSALLAGELIQSHIARTWKARIPS